MGERPSQIPTPFYRSLATQKYFIKEETENIGNKFSREA